MWRVCVWIWCGTVLRVFKVTPYSHSNGNNLKIRLPLKQQNICTCFEKQGNNFLHTAHTHVAEKTRKHCASHSILLILLLLPSLKGYEQNYWHQGKKVLYWKAKTKETCHMNIPLLLKIAINDQKMMIILEKTKNIWPA